MMNTTQTPRPYCVLTTARFNALIEKTKTKENNKKFNWLLESFSKGEETTFMERKPQLCFTFVETLHGLKRFSSISRISTVRTMMSFAKAHVFEKAKFEETLSILCKDGKVVTVNETMFRMFSSFLSETIDKKFDTSKIGADLEKYSEEAIIALKFFIYHGHLPEQMTNETIFELFPLADVCAAEDRGVAKRYNPLLKALRNKINALMDNITTKQAAKEQLTFLHNNKNQLLTEIDSIATFAIKKYLEILKIPFEICPVGGLRLSTDYMGLLEKEGALGEFMRMAIKGIIAEKSNALSFFAKMGSKEAREAIREIVCKGRPNSSFMGSIAPRLVNIESVTIQTNGKFSARSFVYDLQSIFFSYSKSLKILHIADLEPSKTLTLEVNDESRGVPPGFTISLPHDVTCVGDYKNPRQQLPDCLKIRPNPSDEAVR